MEFRVLGPLEVVDEGRPLRLGGARQRGLLALLLLHANELVSSERLIEELWGEAAPSTARKALQIYVSQLRRLLGGENGGPISTKGAGYVLSVEREQVDALRFEDLVAAGRREAAAGRLEASALRFRDALALWRGQALAGLAFDSYARGYVDRLEEERLVAMMDRIDCELALGRHEQLVGELESLVAQHPLRERLRSQLMLALYRSGRQADALAAYREARAALIDELGLEPSASLQRLERAILQHDPALEQPGGVAHTTVAPAQREERRATLDGPRPPDGEPKPRRRYLLALAAGTLVAVAVALWILAGDEPTAPLGVPPNSVGVVDPSRNAVVAAIPVGMRPTGIAADTTSVWVLNEGDGTVTKIDARTRHVVGTRGLPVSRARDIDAVGGSVWVAALRTTRQRYGGERQAPLLVRIDAASQAVTATMQVGAPSLSNAVTEPSLHAESGAIWLAHVGRLFRAGGESGGIDATEVVKAVDVDAGEGAVWVVSRSGGGVEFEPTGVLQRIDPVYATVEETIPLGGLPTAVAVGAGSVWVTRQPETLARIDPVTNSIAATIHVGTRPVDVAVGEGGVWVANEGDKSLSRIDPSTNSVVATIHLGTAPGAVSAANGAVWVTAY